jgi:hypothetical protein
MPGFRNMLRAACRETWSLGAGIGGAAIVVQCKPAPGRQDAAHRYIKDAFAPGLMQSACLARMSLWEADAEVTGGPSPEAILRGGADRSADWVLFLESYELAKTALALQAQLAGGAAAESGLSIESRARYQLIYARTA